MADAKARRDARMRRILANSENRLKKIAGKNCEESDSTCRSFLDNDGTETRSINQTGNGVALANRYDESEQSNEERYIRTESHAEFPSNTHQYVDTTNWVGNNIDDSNKEFNFEEISNLISERTGLKHNANDAIGASNNNLINRIVRSSVIYIILAAIVNLLMFFKLDHLYGRTIFVPFSTVLIARLIIPGSIKQSQKGSLLVAALILCSVKPNVANNINWTVSIINTIVSDFALYVFSFVVMYNLNSYIVKEQLDSELSAK